MLFQFSYFFQHFLNFPIFLINFIFKLSDSFLILVLFILPVYSFLLVLDLNKLSFFLQNITEFVIAGQKIFEIFFAFLLFLFLPLGLLLLFDLDLSQPLFLSLLLLFRFCIQVVGICICAGIGIRIGVGVSVGICIRFNVRAGVSISVGAIGEIIFCICSG